MGMEKRDEDAGWRCPQRLTLMLHLLQARRKPGVTCAYLSTLAPAQASYGRTEPDGKHANPRSRPRLPGA